MALLLSLLFFAEGFESKLQMPSHFIPKYLGVHLGKEKKKNPTKLKIALLFLTKLIIIP